MSMENSFRKRYKSYARVMWKVDSLEKNVKCDNRAVTVVWVTGDKKEPRMFRGKHEF
jgi:hypothetical protein